MSKTNSEIQNDLFSKFELVFNPDDPKNSDVFVSKRFKIITRSGIDKIEAKEGIIGTFKVISATPFEVALIGRFTAPKTGVTIETFGEASIDYIKPIVTDHSITEESKGEDGVVTKTTRTKQVVEEHTLKRGNVGQNPSYLYAIAEKRARARGVLRLAGLYKEGFFGEDEADAFSDELKKARNSSVTQRNV